MRQEHLETLAFMFTDSGIDYNAACGFKNDVVMILTTKEGRKGKGRYKMWKETVLRDFDAIFLEHYKILEEKEQNTCITKPNNSILVETDEEINECLSQMFGFNCPADLQKRAHTVGDYLNIKCLEIIYGD